MIEQEETLEIDDSETAIAYANQMASYHNNLFQIHRQALTGTLGALDHRNKHLLASNLHRLAADLWRSGKTHDAHQVSLAAELLTDRIEGGDWR